MAEMSRESRAMLLNVLWHHQGGSSPVGQPLRKLLGIEPHAHLTDEQMSEAKWIDGLLSRAARGVPAPDALGYATRLACSMWGKHYREDAPDWRPFDNLMGVLSQIDNMVTGLTKKPDGVKEDAK